MASAVGLRADYTGTDIRALARSSRDGNQVRRLLALTVIHGGRMRSEAALGCRRRAIGFCGSAGRGPDGLLDGKAPGQRPLLDAAHKKALAGDDRARTDPDLARRCALAAHRFDAIAA